MPVTNALDDDETVAVGTKISQITAPGNRLIEWIGREKAAAMPHVTAWRNEAERMNRFFTGKQLTASDQKKLQEEGRPDNVFNTAQKFIRFVTGVEASTPEALVFEPIDETSEGQQEFAEVMTRYYDWAIAKSYGDFERSHAFHSLCVTGMGWTDAYVCRAIDPKGLISMKRIPGDEMLWPKTQEQNLAGVRWLGRESLIDKEEAIGMWPDQEALIKIAHLDSPTVAVPRPEAERPVIYTIPYLETRPLSVYESGDSEHNKVRILEWQWFDNKPGYYFYDPLEKDDVWYDDDKFKRYQAALRRVTNNDPAYEIRDFIRQSQKIFSKTFILNDRFQLGGELELPGKRFTFNCMTGYYDDEDKVFFGYMRVLVDPQRFANKFFNQVIEIMGTQAKGGLLVEEGAIPPKHVNTFEKKYAVPGSVNEVSAQAISGKKIMPKPLPELPAASIAVVNFCIQGMENVTGISPETAFGQGSTNVPGITLRQKQKSGLLLLNQEFGALSRFRMEEGYIIFDLLKTLADDRLIRVGRPYEGEVLKLMREPFAAEYDLMLDETERDPNIRHMYAESVQSLAPTLIRMNKFFPELLDYFPLPVKFRQTLKKAIISQAQEEQRMAQEGVQSHGRGSPVSPQERQAKVQRLNSETAVNVAKANRLRGQQFKDAQKMKLDELKTIMKAITDTAKLKLDQNRQAGEVAAKTLELFLKSKEIPPAIPLPKTQVMPAEEQRQKVAAQQFDQEPQ